MDNLSDLAIEQRRLGARIGEAGRAIAQSFIAADELEDRAQAALAARLQAVALEEAEEMDRHAEAMAALRSARDEALADLEQVTIEAARRRAPAIAALEGARPVHQLKAMDGGGQ